MKSCFLPSNCGDNNNNNNNSNNDSINKKENKAKDNSFAEYQLLCRPLSESCI